VPKAGQTSLSQGASGLAFNKRLGVSENYKMGKKKVKKNEISAWRTTRETKRSLKRTIILLVTKGLEQNEERRQYKRK